MIQNLTEGNVFKLITLFSLPILIGNLFQQFYNISDILIVGRLLGVNALAAVGATAPVYFLFLLISFGFTGGLTVVTAQAFGANHFNKMRKSMTHAIFASTFLSITITIFLSLFLRPLLRLMNVPLEIENDAWLFMIILTGAMVMIVFYNLLFGFLRALGDSKTPLYFLILSTVLNVLFNFVLIYHFNFGVEGSALGTVTAIGITLILCLIYTYYKFPIMHLKKEDFKYDQSLLIEQLKIALPMALQFSVLGLGILIIQSVSNSFGKEVIAAFTASLRIEQVATQPLVAIGAAIATFSAQNWGACKINRIRQGVRFGVFVSLIISLTASLLVRYIGRDMISVFLNEENEFIIETGKKYLSISTLFYFFLGMIFIFRNVLQGMGKALIPLLASLIELFVRTIVAVCFSSVLGWYSVIYASTTSWIIAATVVVIGYILTLKKLKNNKKSKTYFKKNKHEIGVKSALNSTPETPSH